MEAVTFVMSGKQFNLSRKDVERSMKDVLPGRIHTHAVEINGRLYPVKEAFARSIGKDNLDFNTQEARRIFTKLGFEMRRVS